MNKQTLAFQIVAAALIATIPLASSAQQSDLNNMLNSVDNAHAWAKTPVSDVQAMPPPANFPVRDNLPSQGFMNQNQAPWLAPTQLVPQTNNKSLMQNLSGTNAMSPYGVQSPAGTDIRRQMLKIFLGGSPSGSMDTLSQSGSSEAYSNWQEAENQAVTARNYAGTARSDQDKWTRKDSASRANYAANAARAASDRVYQASLNGDQTAKQYAGRARDAADRARADADRADYDANADR